MAVNESLVQVVLLFYTHAGHFDAKDGMLGPEERRVRESGAGTFVASMRRDVGIGRRVQTCGSRGCFL